MTTKNRSTPTHVVEDGPEDGVPLVLVHGATVPHWEFDRIAPYLTAGGYRLLRFDLYGHGQSARPRIDYTIDDFVAQTKAVLRDARWPARGHVLGHSLGAAVVSRLVADSEDHSYFDRVILTAPMLNFSRRNPVRRWMRTPILGEAFMACVGLPMLIRRRRRRYASLQLDGLTQRFRSQVRERGFVRALLAMERNGTLDDQSRSYRALATRAHPTLVVRGERDTIMDADDARTICGILGADYTELPSLGHNFLLAAPELAAATIQRFLRGAQVDPKPLSPAT